MCRDTGKIPNETNSLLFSLADDTSEGVVLLSSALKCGWSATDFMHYFPLFSFAHFLHISEAKSSLGWGEGLARKRIQVWSFFFRYQRTQVILPGEQWGVQSTVGFIKRGPSPNQNMADPLLVFHRLLLRPGGWNTSPILGCFTSLWKRERASESESDRKWKAVALGCWWGGRLRGTWRRVESGKDRNGNRREMSIPASSRGKKEAPHLQQHFWEI